MIIFGCPPIQDTRKSVRVNIRSKAKHDEWQKLLPCKVLQLDGADRLEDNFLRVEACIYK